MATQLAFDFAPPAPPAFPEIQNEDWLDVTAIARGLGFTGPVELGVSLNDALQSDHDEPEEAYDQRLFDCLWLVHLQWTLSEEEAATLSFFFERANSTAETRLQIRLEFCEGIVRLDLLKQEIYPPLD